MSKQQGLLTPEQANKFVTAMIPHAKNYQSNIIFSGMAEANGIVRPAYQKENQVRKVVRQHSKGYYYVISVSDTDDVFYQVYNGGKLGYLSHKATGLPHWPRDCIAANAVWKSIRKRTHLPATVGAAYLEIDKDIEAHKQTLEHDDYAKGVLDAEPDGLKMIEGLEKLAEGDPDDEVKQISVPAYGFNSSPNSGMYTSGPQSFYLSSASEKTTALLCDGDVEIKGDLTIDGQSFDDKVSEALSKSIVAKQDASIMAIVEEIEEIAEETATQ
jgi:hypothetical protein